MATVEKLEQSKVKMTLEISAESFDEALQKAFVTHRGRYAVPGFRKGKAPRKVIENVYGEGVFYEDAFDIIYDDAYQSAIKENGLEPVDTPEISIEQIGKGQPLVFSATVDVRPEVLLGSYKGIEVVRREYTVEDAEVDAAIEREREKVARYVNMERPVQDGDQVVLDYSGSIDGVNFDGGTAKEQTLTIGSHTFIPGFEEQLVGMSKDEERDITVTFPEEYQSKELAGKDAVFHVLIHEIQTKELPELDDEFAQDVSEFNTLCDLRADRRAAMEKRNNERAQAEMENDAVEKVANNATIDVPESMVRRQAEGLLREFAYRLSMSGLTLEKYCEFTGKTIEALYEEYRPAALDRIRTQLVLEAVADAEGIAPTEEDTDKEIAAYCAANQVDAEEFRKETVDTEYFQKRARVEKTVAFLLENCVYIDAPPADEEASAADAPAEETGQE